MLNSEALIGNPIVIYIWKYKMKKLFKLFVVILLCNAGSLLAQKDFSAYKFDSTKTYAIETIDDTRFIGKFQGKESGSVVLKTMSGTEIKIPIKNIKSIEEVKPSQLKDGEYWFQNPHAERYFLGNSAIPLDAGEGYYQNIWILLNTFNVGISDFMSIGGGFELLSAFGTGNAIFFVTPKAGFKIVDKFHAGVGALYVSVPNFANDRSTFGSLYAIGIYGSHDHNITGGLGWGFVEGEFVKHPMINISGMTRIRKNFALISENWILPLDAEGNQNMLLSYGVRFFGENISVDLAFINNRHIVQMIFIGIPYVDFVVKF